MRTAAETVRDHPGLQFSFYLETVRLYRCFFFHIYVKEINCRRSVKGEDMKKRRWICLALTAALTIGMLAGCGQKKDLSDGGEKKELQKVTLNEVAHSIFYAPMYVAIEEGLADWLAGSAVSPS